LELLEEPVDFLLFPLSLTGLQPVFLEDGLILAFELLVALNQEVFHQVFVENLVIIADDGL
jgi:hypothetical protein